MLVIPIQSVPSQQLACVLGNQNARISIYLLNDDIFFDLNSGGINMSLGVIARNGVPLDSSNSYDGFQGNLYFIDLQGSDDPVYTGLGSRWVLIYLTAAEVLLTQTPITAVPVGTPILTLATTLEVTSSIGGNFSVAHGLAETPFLIEIVPTSAGIIWAQGGYADGTNVNLVASDASITATVLVYTVAASAVSAIQIPAATIDLIATVPGNFSVPHGLGVIPSSVDLLPTSGGMIWLLSFDATNLNLNSSGPATAIANVYAPVVGAFNVKAPVLVLTVISTIGGPLVTSHYQQKAPSRIEILPISPMMWAQDPAFDDLFLYLEASDVGVVARVAIYA